MSEITLEHLEQVGSLDEPQLRAFRDAFPNGIPMTTEGLRAAFDLRVPVDVMGPMPLDIEAYVIVYLGHEGAYTLVSKLLPVWKTFGARFDALEAERLRKFEEISASGLEGSVPDKPPLSSRTREFLNRWSAEKAEPNEAYRAELAAADKVFQQQVDPFRLALQEAERMASWQRRKFLADFPMEFIPSWSGVLFGLDTLALQIQQPDLGNAQAAFQEATKDFLAQREARQEAAKLLYWGQIPQVRKEMQEHREALRQESESRGDEPLSPLDQALQQAEEAADAQWSQLQHEYQDEFIRQALWVQGGPVA